MSVVCLGSLVASLIPGGAGEGDPLTYSAEGGVALAWAGEELAIVTPEGIHLASPKSTLARPFFAPSGGVLPLLATTPGFLAGVTVSGEVVVWDAQSRREVGRRPGGTALGSESVLALAPGGMQFLIGNGSAELFRVSLDSPLPKPVGYPGPGKVRALGFDATGNLVALPSRWSWSRSTGAWTPGTPLDFQDADGINRLAWAPQADLLAIFRSERPTHLALDSGLVVDLGYREPMDMVLDPAGALALVSFPGAPEELGSGDAPRVGSLEGFDTRTGERLLLLPRAGVDVAPAEATDHRTLGLGLAMAALGGGHFATVDFVDHHGLPSLFLRLRGPDLVASAELKLGAGHGPVHLAIGGGLLAVVYEEQQVDVFDVATLSAESTPQLSLPIDAQSDPTATAPLPPRDVFALSMDGNILAMGGPSGTFYFANPRTGWPNEIVSVNLARGAGRPLAARFTADGSFVVVSEDPAGLFERMLDPTFTRWTDLRAVLAVGQVSLDGARRVELRHGALGNLDVYRGAVTDGLLFGHLVARQEIGPEPLDALALSELGSLAWARDGKIQHAKLEVEEDGAEHGPR